MHNTGQDEKAAGGALERKHDGCYRCWYERVGASDIVALLCRPMFLCPTCGNKRCPKASDHRLTCTGSNAVGQQGSIYA